MLKAERIVPDESPDDGKKRRDSAERPAFEEDGGDEGAEARPTHNWELKELIIKQAKGSTEAAKSSKRRVTGRTSSNLDLRAELSRRRAERMNKVNFITEILDVSAFKNLQSHIFYLV